MIKVHDFLLWFTDYEKQALVNNERRLVVLSGGEFWALSLLKSIDLVSEALKNNFNQGLKLPFTSSECLIYGDSSLLTATIQKKRFRDQLGSETNIIIFADSEFSVDAFAALSGTLKAGGIFFLVIPSLSEQLSQSRFFQRFYSLIQNMASHTIISESQTTLLPRNADSCRDVREKLTATYPFGCLTEGQYCAVTAIGKVLSGHRKRPLVLTADRGRGKSSALAIACAQLMKAHENNEFVIIITAPDTKALIVFYQQLTERLLSVKHQGNTITFGKAKLIFMPVDQLIKMSLKVNLVLVDEAAAIPVYLLEKLLRRYHRMVFSSTVHGYEGAGRGFTLKFQKILDRLCPQWLNLHLTQPIRWRDNDPLEQLVFDACLLNAELPSLTLSATSQTKSPLAKQSPMTSSGHDSLIHSQEVAVFKVITAEQLIADELLLQQVFAILVTAHYQTKPSDLQLLLDNPKVQLSCLFSSKNTDAVLLGVALLMGEGKGNDLNATDIRAIKNSERRLRNHFLPQSLLSHSGFEIAFNYQYLRIMRIAVHPQIQQQGIGSVFIKHIELLASAQGADFIGTSFGLNVELLSFWFKAGFSTARIGFTQDKASGEHSALLIKGLNEQGEQKQQQLQSNFYQSFDYLLLEEYKKLTTELVYLLLRQQPKENLLSLSELDRLNVQAFSTGERLYSSCCYSMYLWLKHDLLVNEQDDSAEIMPECLVLIARLVQKHDTETICQQFGLTGKKMLNKKMQDYIYLRLNIIEN